MQNESKQHGSRNLRAENDINFLIDGRVAIFSRRSIARFFVYVTCYISSNQQGFFRVVFLSWK